jgi:ELWxxDGT repeat protein
MGGVVYFAADDGIHGTELWRSDYISGTNMVKDISTGSVSSNIQSLTVAGDKLYFTSNNILWVSDGTTNGTYEVPGVTYTGDVTTCLTPVGNILYFFTNISRLWKTDGTLAGTSMIIDFYQTYNYTKGFLAQLTNINGTLFFTLGWDNDYGAELWKSDGTMAGTMMVKDIFPGTTGSGPLHLTPVNGKLYFSANDGTGAHLWVTDGTANGTVAVPNNFEIKLQHDSVYHFAFINNVLFFKGATTGAGYELCMYNTTGNKSIALVKDINAGPGNSNPSNITAAGDKIFFTATNAAGKEQLWTSDGTAAGTKSIKTAARYAKFSHLSWGDGTVLFSFNTLANGNELWKSDGTEAGTILVADIYPGSGSAYPAYTTYVNRGVFVFSANNGSKGVELWLTNGTAAGTAPVKNINSNTTAGSDPNLYSNLDSTAYLNGKLFFNAHEPRYENELYVSDGTTGGTQLVKDLNPAGSCNPVNFIVFKNAVYFSGSNGIYQTIFRSDGTADGTQEVVNIGNRNGIVNKLVAGTDWFYILFYNTDSNRQELWRSDGTSNGSFRLQILPGHFQYFEYNAPNYSVATVGNVLYFGEDDLVHGVEPWTATGEAGSAALLKDIAPGNQSSYPAGFYAFKNRMYFGAWDASNNNYLWVSNGKASGTQVLKDVAVLEGLSGATQAKGHFFFAATTSETGSELYISDGTSAGTHLIADLVPGAQGSFPHSFKVFDSAIYFIANDALYQTGLWKTNGFKKGTTLVKNVNINVYPALTIASDKLYFTAYDGFSYPLWVSDGTESGTNPVDDAGLAGVNINQYLGTQNKLFINGSTYALGNELYAGLVPGALLRGTDNISSANALSRMFQAYLTVNPVKEAVRFNVVSGERRSLELNITDMNGKRLTHDSKVLNPGINSFAYPVAGWASGIYVLNLAAGGSVVSLKFVK